MRTTRWFIAGLFCSASLSAAASAQQSRYFDDSWFWGVKSGVATFSPTLGGNETAATFGGEWLITRSRGGLYISADQANVSTVSAVVDANTSDGVRPVTVNKLRRIGFAALGIDNRMNGIPLQGRPVVIRAGRSVPDRDVVVTPRIGITQAADWPLRYFVRDNQFVSRTR